MPVTLNANDWTALGKAKRLAVLCRLSVVHLTVISCVSGGLLAGAAGKGNALRSTLWTATLCLWHLSHNVINDLQDLDVGRDESKGAFRRSYGCHPVAQGFVSRKDAMKVVFGLTAAAAAGSAASVALAPACAWAIPAGLAATLLYTPLAKPCALGELLVYLVWGPAMVGGGYAATAGVHSPLVTWAASVPLGLGAFAMIFGKHIDKIAEPVRTLPKLLGRKLAKATAATALIVSMWRPCYSSARAFSRPRACSRLHLCRSRRVLRCAYSSRRSRRPKNHQVTSHTAGPSSPSSLRRRGRSGTSRSRAGRRSSTATGSRSG